MIEHGQRMHAQNVVLRGRLSVEEWKAFLVECVHAMDMTPAGDPAVWRYPNEEGKGGVGTTICQPITESFIVADVWDDHDGAYLHVSSCRPFSAASLVGPARSRGLAMERLGVIEVLEL